MPVDVKKFFQVTNPSKTLVVENAEDQKYYIDFSEVRGGKILEEIKENITLWSTDNPTCTLFTGHIGCGKSTELLRLKKELGEEDFHVVYFESSEDLEMADVDIGDVLLAVARRVYQSLDQIELAAPRMLYELLQGTAQLLQTEIKIPGVQVSANQVALDIGKITAKAKNDSCLRERLNQYLGPRKTKLLAAINEELLEPAIEKLKQQGKKGLVVIVDNLDRMDNRTKAWGRPQQEYLFIDQSEYLTKLRCHLVYTMPLALKFSSDYGDLTQRFPEEPKVLPMVPVRQKDGSSYQAGMALLRQMVLARAFPNLDEDQRLEKITEIFDSAESLDYLCRTSGGHVRHLLRLLNDWIKKERQLPLSLKSLETVICARRTEITMPISNDEWELLRQVQQDKKVNRDRRYQALIRSRQVFEYRSQEESWFDINPVLAQAKELQL